jgi:hypothetical protein
METEKKLTPEQERYIAKQKEMDRLYASKISYRFTHVLKEARQLIIDSGIKSDEKTTITVLLDLAQEHANKSNGNIEKMLTTLKNKRNY